MTELNNSALSAYEAPTTIRPEVERAAQAVENNGVVRKDIPLGLPTPPNGGHEITFDPNKGDKGLSYMLLRLYKNELPSAQDARDAAFGLTALLMRKMNEANPRFEPGDKISISNDTVVVLRKNAPQTMFTLDLGFRGVQAPEREEQKRTVNAEAARQSAQLMEEVLSVSDQTPPPETGREAVAKKPLRKMLDEAFRNREMSGYASVDRSAPTFGIEAYQIQLEDGRNYYVAAKLTGRRRDGSEYVRTAPKYSLIQDGYNGTRLVNWTDNFDEVTSHLA